MEPTAVSATNHAGRGGSRGGERGGVSAVFAGEGRPKNERGRQVGPNDEIRTAILGIRNQGKNHIGYHQATPNVRIATLCDPDERLFAERVGLVAGGKPATEVDLRRVLDDKNIDCVCIAMPNYWHALATVWACQAGKDVYVEKPATYCIAEGRKMIAAGKMSGRVVQNGTHMRPQRPPRGHQTAPRKDPRRVVHGSGLHL